MIVTLAVRVLQLLFAAIVMALSVVLVDQYGPGHAPSIYAYGTFCGGAALIIGAVGIIACFVEKLQGLVMLGLDAFASFFLLAGGIAMAVTFKAGSCTDDDYIGSHSSTFGANQDQAKFFNGDTFSTSKYIADLEARCRMSQADTAFVWFTFAAAVGALALSFMVKSRGSSSIV